jgi:hypothetical protein
MWVVSNLSKLLLGKKETMPIWFFKSLWTKPTPFVGWVDKGLD